MSKGTLRQILLITDGCSNSGENPVDSATFAFKNGMTVNVIGILEDELSEADSGLEEVEQIAAAGGGISQIVFKEELSQTVQAVTRQAMTQTLQGFVNKELTQIFGENRSLEEIEPEKRGEVMEVVEDLGEKSNLEVLILVDTSASMRDKLLTVKEALIDLSINLHARMGKNIFSVYRFPSKRQTTELIQDWSEELNSVSVIFPKLTTGGLTPTGPALRDAVYQFSKIQLKGRLDDAEAYPEER